MHTGRCRALVGVHESESQKLSLRAKSLRRLRSNKLKLIRADDLGDGLLRYQETWDAACRGAVCFIIIHVTQTAQPAF